MMLINDAQTSSKIEINELFNEFTNDYDADMVAITAQFLHDVCNNNSDYWYTLVAMNKLILKSLNLHYVTNRVVECCYHQPSSKCYGSVELVIHHYNESKIEVPKFKAICRAYAQHVIDFITSELELETRLELSHSQCVWVIMIITDFTNYHHIMHDAEVLRTLFNDDDEGSYCIDQLSQAFFGRLLDVVQADALAKAVYDEAMTVAIETK